MKLLLNIDHCVAMHMQFHPVSLVIGELLSFDCRNLNDFSVLGHNFV